MPHSDTARAAPAETVRDPRNADLAGGLISATYSTARSAAEELFRPPDTEPILPLVAAARERDRLARWRLGLPQQDFRRRQTYAAAIAREEFGEAQRRGRRGRGRRR